MAGKRWAVYSTDDRQGPFTLPELKKLIAAGRVQPGDLVFQPGRPSAVPASSLADLLAKSPSPPSQTAPNSVAESAVARPTTRRRVVKPAMKLLLGAGVAAVLVAAITYTVAHSGRIRGDRTVTVAERDVKAEGVAPVASPEPSAVDQKTASLPPNVEQTKESPPTAVVPAPNIQPPTAQPSPAPPAPVASVAPPTPKAPPTQSPPVRDDPSKVGLVRVMNHGADVPGVAFSPDGTQVLIGDGNGVLRLWNTKTGEVDRQWDGHPGSRIVYVTYSADGSLAASCGSDRCVRVWNVKTGAERNKLTGFSQGIQSAKFSSDSQFLITGTIDEKTCLRYWNLTNGREVPRFDSPKAHTTLIIDLSRDDQFVLSAGPNPLRLWDVRTGKVVRSVEPKTCCWGAVLLSDGNRVLSSGDKGDNAVHLWNLTTGREVRRYTGHTEGLQALAVTPDDRLVVSGGWDKTVRVWNVASGQQRAVFEGHEKGVRRVAVSRDGKYAVSGSYDGTARLWRLPEP